MKFLARVLPFAALLTPALALAQFDEIDELGANVTLFINNTIVPLIFAIAFVVFLWGVVKFFIIGKDSEIDKESARNYMLWGIGGFVLMVSIWGIVNLIAGGLNLTNERILNIPDAPTENN